MDIIYNILCVILSAAVTSFFSVLATKYTYSKKIPLDKLEITYNRVYYPISKLIKSSTMEEVQEKAKPYFVKYDKYVDRSTMRLYKDLCSRDPIDLRGRKAAYQELVNNISNRCEYLRKRLGYLEPSFFRLYTEAPKPLKVKTRILLELCFIYLTVTATYFTSEKITSVLEIIIGILCAAVILEIVIRLIIAGARKIFLKVRRARIKHSRE